MSNNTTNKSEVAALAAQHEELTQQFLNLAKRYERMNELYRKQMELAAQRHFSQLAAETDLEVLDVCFYNNGLIPTGFSETGEPMWDTQEVERLMKRIPTLASHLTLVK